MITCVTLCFYVQLGNTALHIASKKNFMEVAQALLTYAHKANACISNKTKVRW